MTFRLLPRTLFGQLVLALFIGLIAAQMAGFWLMLDDRARYGQRMVGVYAAQRIAGAISLLDRAAPEDRARLVDALDVPPLYLSTEIPWQPALSSVPEDAALLMERVAKELERPAEMQVLSVRRATSPQRAPPTLAGDQPVARPPDGRVIVYVEGQARLLDGSVVTFRHGLRMLAPDEPYRLLALLLMLGISVAILSGWTVRRLTRPLAALADAATGLAQNLEQPPLPESGPLEVSRAAGAFNAMQRELRRYLQTRAQALAAVSHDLRLPITRLRLRLERIPEGATRDGMETDLAEMESMIENTLAFLRAGSTAEEVQRLDLDALLESAADDVRMLGAEVKLHGTIHEPVPGRPQALRRCIANLLDNAWRYGDGRVDVTLVDGPAEVQVRIEDHGPGVSPEDAERVFDPYVRLEASRAKHTGGSGLGLAIARAIARSHGGDVRLLPRAGGGACALLTLPRPGSQMKIAA